MYLRSPLNNNAMENILPKMSAFFCLWICSCSSNENLPNNINTKASFPDSIKFSPAGLKVITSFINRKSGTMSTLYGNPLALKSATGLNKALAGGEAFTLVTWKQQPDEHWFGANIPGDLQSVEILKTISNGDTVAINYQRYEGKAFAQNSDTLMKNKRIKFILDQRPSVMP
jgi:hypothetical protein